MGSRSLPRRRFREIPAALILFLGLVSTGWSAGDPPGQSAPAATFEVRGARTTFVFRRTLSADRVGVLGMTPEEGEHVKADSIVARLKDDVPVAAVAAAAAKAQSDAEIVAADKLAESERLEARLMEEANRNNTSSRKTYPQSDIDRAGCGRMRPICRRP